MEQLIYVFDCKNVNIKVTKMLDIDELIQNAYKIAITNKETLESDFVTTNTPQGAMALVDYMEQKLGN